jgi:hypothetical protein
MRVKKFVFLVSTLKIVNQAVTLARKRKPPKIVLNDLALIVLHLGQRFLKMNIGLP